jgi:hypothetical protein
MKKKELKSYHTGTVKKTIKINASKQKVWRKISNIVGLPSWLIDVKKTVYLSKKKRGVDMLQQFLSNQKQKIQFN